MADGNHIFWIRLKVRHSGVWIQPQSSICRQKRFKITAVVLPFTVLATLTGCIQKEDADSYLPFTGRDQYLLVRESGVEHADVGAGYIEIERIYRYSSAGGDWMRQTVKKVENLKGN